MSVQSLSWAFKQEIPKSSSKFVLVALANFANEDGECYPSVETLCKMSSLDRKTVISALGTLCADGWIEDTGRRCGATHQVKVYRLNFERADENREENETKQEAKKGHSVPVSSRSKDTENGTVKLSQKRNSTKNGTVPFFRGNSTVFPMKESQKRDTEPLEEPLEEPSAAYVRKRVLLSPTKAAAAVVQNREDTPPDIPPDIPANTLADTPLLAMSPDQLERFQKTKPTKLVLQFEREHPEQKWRDELYAVGQRAKVPPVLKARHIVDDLLPRIKHEQVRASQPSPPPPVNEGLKRYLARVQAGGQLHA